MQVDELKSGQYLILLICEGSAEEDIINCLLDADRLLFCRKDLVDHKVIRSRSAEKIEQQYLSFRHRKPLVIIRILDSRKEVFKLSKVYKEQYNDKVFNVFTRPEIEILLIISKGDFHVYSQKFKQKTKPSEFCKIQYQLRDIKQKGALIDEIGTTEMLVKTLKDYAQLSSGDSLCLFNLLKTE